MSIQSIGFPGGSAVKNLPAMQETQVRSLGQEDPLEEGMATYSSILAWRNPWTEGPWGRTESDTTEQLSSSSSLQNSFERVTVLTTVCFPLDMANLSFRPQRQACEVSFVHPLWISSVLIMASGPIPSWQIDGKTVADFILGSPKPL